MHMYDDNLKNNRGSYRKLPMMNGKVRNVPIKNLVGKCHHPAHKGYIDVDLLNRHDCINKQCRKLEKFEELDFWIKYNEEANRKRIAKEKKEASIAWKYSENRREQACLDKLLKGARQFVADAGYPIVLTRISIRSHPEYGRGYIINYASDSPFNDWKTYYPLVKKMRKCYKGGYTLRRVRKPDGKFATIDDLPEDLKQECLNGL